MNSDQISIFIRKTVTNVAVVVHLVVDLVNDKKIG